jgi:hypothetical protein
LAARAFERSLQRQSTHSTQGAIRAQHHWHQGILQRTSIDLPCGALSVNVHYDFNALIEGVSEKVSK